MAANFQYFGDRLDFVPNWVNESSSISDSHLDDLASLVQKLSDGQKQRVNTCGICQLDNLTDMCPLLQDDMNAQFCDVGVFQNPPPPMFDSYLNTYSQGWWDYPNYNFAMRPTSQPAPASGGSSLEDLVKSLATSTAQLQQSTAQLQQSTTQFQQETRAGMHNLETQISQLTTTVNRLESQLYEKLPSQPPEVNLKTISAIDVVEEKVENEGSQPQISPMEESSEQPRIMVISSPSSSQCVLEFHSICPVVEIDFIIPKEFDFHGRNNLGVMMTTKLLIGHDGGVSEDLKLLFDCLAPPTSQWKKRARVRKDYSTYEGYEDYVEKKFHYNPITD